MHNFEEIYERILEILKDISPEQLQPYQRRRPKMSDLELVALSLSGEYLGVDSEHDLFRKLPAGYVKKIERSVFNRRRRRLFVHIESIRRHLSDILNRSERVFIVDSMPLEVCRLSRSDRSTICREEPFSSPDRESAPRRETIIMGTSYMRSAQRAMFSIALTSAPHRCTMSTILRTSRPKWPIAPCLATGVTSPHSGSSICSIRATSGWTRP